MVKALIADLITPIVGLIFGKRDFGALSFTINGSLFRYGDFLNNLITFITTAAAVFFFVVKPYNHLMARRGQEDPDTKECPECTSAIPVKAIRCPHRRFGPRGNSLLGLLGAGVQLLGPGGLLVGEGGLLGRVLAQS